jgi:hypothetical protein
MKDMHLLLYQEISGSSAQTHLDSCILHGYNTSGRCRCIRKIMKFLWSGKVHGVVLPTGVEEDRSKKGK